jgi:hypothetical protein
LSGSKSTFTYPLSHEISTPFSYLNIQHRQTSDEIADNALKVRQELRKFPISGKTTLLLPKLHAGNLDDVGQNNEVSIMYRPWMKQFIRKYFKHISSRFSEGAASFTVDVLTGPAGIGKTKALYVLTALLRNSSLSQIKRSEVLMLPTCRILDNRSLYSCDGSLFEREEIIKELLYAFDNCLDRDYIEKFETDKEYRLFDCLCDISFDFRSQGIYMFLIFDHLDDISASPLRGEILNFLAKIGTVVNTLVSFDSNGPMMEFIPRDFHIFNAKNYLLKLDEAIVFSRLTKPDILDDEIEEAWNISGGVPYELKQCLKHRDYCTNRYDQYVRSFESHMSKLPPEHRRSAISQTVELIMEEPTRFIGSKCDKRLAVEQDGLYTFAKDFESSDTVTLIRNNFLLS